MVEKLSQIELAYRGKSVKTFDKEVYELKGSLAINQKNGEVKKIADIYYNVRTALDDKKRVIGKRKKRTDELQK